jgi:hypothetical protein
MSNIVARSSRIDINIFNYSIKQEKQIRFVTLTLGFDLSFGFLHLTFKKLLIPDLEDASFYINIKV